MADRSLSQRLSGALRAILACLSLAFLAGCQSNAQQDLVVRELRTQEDQLYAMEDYLNQYQQLVCKYRSENAALKQQLAEQVDTDTDLPSPGTRPRPLNGTRPSLNGPRTGSPQSPAIDKPPTQVAPPDVPPLGTSSQDDSASDVDAATDILMVSDSIRGNPAEQIPSPLQIEVRCQVVENEAVDGPRLVVDVAASDDAGESVAVAGALSLMLLAPDDAGAQQSLARWDFGPDEVRSAATADGAQGAQFLLALPAEATIEQPVELWARLLPGDDGKLLTHVPVDLMQTTPFTSLVDVPPEPGMFDDPSVVATAHNEPELLAPPIAYDVVDAGWSTARPGEPAGPVDTGKADSDWRASSEPPPAAIVRSTPSRHRPPAANRKDVAEKTSSPAAKPTVWSPERPGSAADATPRTASAPQRPSWSATR